MRLQRLSVIRTAAHVVLIAAACRPSAPTPARVDDTAAVPSLGTPTPRRGVSAGGTLVDSLERVARGLARTDGCADAGACHAAPLGAKACGGPRDYLMYCARTTDTVALFRALVALERAERAANASSGTMSTCELHLPPAPALVGGQCTSGAGGVGTGADGPR